MNRISGGGGGEIGQGGQHGQFGQGGADAVGSKYRGAQGLDPEFIKSLEKQFGFDKPAYERFFLMMKNYLMFDFGTSYFRDASVLELIKEKLPVSMSLGIWMTLISYLISIPLGIRKAVRDGEKFDTWTRGILVVGYAVPGFLLAVLLLVVFAGGSFFQWFPLTRADIGELVAAELGGKDCGLCLASRAAAHGNGARRVHDHGVPDQELVPGRDPQAIRADGAREGIDREPGSLRPCVSQCHAAGHRGLSGRLHPCVLLGLAGDRNDLLARRAGAALVRMRSTNGIIRSYSPTSTSSRSWDCS